jgi:hypothetical protein
LTVHLSIGIRFDSMGYGQSMTGSDIKEMMEKYHGESGGRDPTFLAVEEKDM